MHDGLQDFITDGILMQRLPFRVLLWHHYGGFNGYIGGHERNVFLFYFFLSCKTGCKNIVYAINTVKCNNRAVKQCRQLW